MSNYYYFLVEGIKVPLGYVRSSFVKTVSWPETWTLDHDKRLLVLSCKGGFAERAAAMQATIRAEVERGEVPELRKLKNELFAAYSADGQHVLDMDGCAVDKFGTKAFGVHMIGYVDTTEGWRYWVP